MDTTHPHVRDLGETTIAPAHLSSASATPVSAMEHGLDWLRFTHPVTSHFARLVRETDLRGKRIAGWMHLLPDTILTIMPFIEAGASFRVGACNPDSTDPEVVAYLRAHGVEVFEGQPGEAYDATLRAFASGPLDAICDMGGELIEAAVHQGTMVAGALEATTTGLHRLNRLELPFPVFDWNGISIKDALHNRYHVGEETWPAFSRITGLSLFDRTVLVVGFGPVGKGVAERARAMGATVLVAEIDPVRSLEAGHFGCRVLPLADAVSRASVIVTATGLDGALGKDALAHCRDGAVVFNVGHSNREIDVDWLNQHPHRTKVQHVEQYTLQDRDLYLLNRGSMVNLAHTTGFASSESFDPFTAIMLAGLNWILAGGAGCSSPGLQRYPRSLEQEVATFTLQSRAERR